MAQRIAVRRLPDGRWGVCCTERGYVLESHDTEERARRATRPLSEMTPGERAARLPTWNRADTERIREDDLVRRLRDGSPLSKKDAKDARRILRSRKASCPGIDDQSFVNRQHGVPKKGS